MARISPTSGLTSGDQSDLIEIRENNTTQILSAMNQAIAAALEEIGLSAERFAKQETPVDTGRLRNSITHAISMDEQAVYVGTNVSYARFVENDVHVGGKVRTGRHMLRNAATNHTDYYRNVLKKHLQSG